MRFRNNNLIHDISYILNDANRDLNLFPRNCTSTEDLNAVDRYNSQLDRLLSLHYSDLLYNFFCSAEEYLSKKILDKIANSESLTDLDKAYLWSFIATRPALGFLGSTWQIKTPYVTILDIKNSQNKVILFEEGCCSSLYIDSYYLDIDNLDQINRLRNYTTLLKMEGEESFILHLDDTAYVWDKEKEILVTEEFSAQLDKDKKKWVKLEERKTD